jgi:hypothetical protein
MIFVVQGLLALVSNLLTHFFGPPLLQEMVIREVFRVGAMEMVMETMKEFFVCCVESDAGLMKVIVTFVCGFLFLLAFK